MLLTKTSFFSRSATTTTTTSLFSSASLLVPARSVARRARRHSLSSALDAPRALEGEKDESAVRASLFRKRERASVAQAWLKRFFLYEKK